MAGPAPLGSRQLFSASFNRTWLMHQVDFRIVEYLSVSGTGGQPIRVTTCQMSVRYKITPPDAIVTQYIVIFCKKSQFLY